MEHKPAASKPQRRPTRPASTQQPPAAVREAQRPQPAGTPLASTSKPSRDWFGLLLLFVFGLALLGFAFAAGSEFRAAAALTTARSRLGSKGLSARRTAMRDKPRRSGGIRYRD